MNPFGLLVIFVGLFSIAGAAFDWDWFIHSRKARLFVAILGRNGARVFYAIFGIMIVIFGILIAMGVIPMKRFG